jgi:hypothetical protein
MKPCDFQGCVALARDGERYCPIHREPLNRRQTAFTVPCRECGGRGWTVDLNSEALSRECTRCKGTGQVPDPHLHPEFGI